MGAEVSRISNEPNLNPTPQFLSYGLSTIGIVPRLNGDITASLGATPLSTIRNIQPPVPLPSYSNTQYSILASPRNTRYASSSPSVSEYEEDPVSDSYESPKPSPKPKSMFRLPLSSSSSLGAPSSIDDEPLKKIKVERCKRQTGCRSCGQKMGKGEYRVVVQWIIRKQQDPIRQTDRNPSQMVHQTSNSRRMRDMNSNVIEGGDSDDDRYEGQKVADKYEGERTTKPFIYEIDSLSWNATNNGHNKHNNKIINSTHYSVYLFMHPLCFRDMPVEIFPPMYRLSEVRPSLHGYSVHDLSEVDGLFNDKTMDYTSQRYLMRCIPIKATTADDDHESEEVN